MHVSERRACAALGQHRSTQRKVPRGRDDEQRLTTDIIALARQYGRYGYRKIAGLLRQAGWAINDKRVERIWRREGLKVPSKQPKRGRQRAAYQKQFGIIPSFRIGIHGGDVIVSEQGDTKRSIGIYGDAINIAARMEEVVRAHNVRCIVSDAVVAALSNHDRLCEIGEETVKGISSSIRVYEYQPRVDVA